MPPPVPTIGPPSVAETVTTSSTAQSTSTPCRRAHDAGSRAPPGSGSATAKTKAETTSPRSREALAAREAAVVPASLRKRPFKPPPRITRLPLEPNRGRVPLDTVPQNPTGDLFDVEIAPKAREEDVHLPDMTGHGHPGKGPPPA